MSVFLSHYSEEEILFLIKDTIQGVKYVSLKLAKMEKESAFIERVESFIGDLDNVKNGKDYTNALIKTANDCSAFWKNRCNNSNDYGFAESIFLINLIIKNLAPSLTPYFKDFIHAPLNTQELTQLTKKENIKDDNGELVTRICQVRNETIYNEIMDSFKKCAQSLKLSTYELELIMWNHPDKTIETLPKD